MESSAYEKYLESIRSGQTVRPFHKLDMILLLQYERARVEYEDHSSETCVR